MFLLILPQHRSHFYVELMYVTSCFLTTPLCVCSLGSPFSLVSVFLSFSSPPHPFLSPFPHIFFIPSHDLYFNLLSCTFLDISHTFIFPLILAFHILFIFVIPHIHITYILISRPTSLLLFCFLRCPCLIHNYGPYISLAS